MRWALAFAAMVMADGALADVHNGLCQSLPRKPLETMSSGTQSASGNWAIYVEPTDIYQHGVLGDAIEAESIFLGSNESLPTHWGSTGVYIDAGENHVFEDTNPRIADVDGDGFEDVIAVRSSLRLGAQLVVYSGQNMDCNDDRTLASTPYIGQRNRWLAPIGAADLDGDGTMEIAYIDRPHLAKTLRIVSIDGDLLAEEIAGAGFTNHRIGERDIAGGVRDCGDGPEMIVASADWSQLVAVTYDGNSLSARQIGTDTSRPAFANAMTCQ